jgi:integrase
LVPDMPAASSLKPRKIESRVAIGWAPWCVNVPAELSETGKRQRKFFETEKAAKAECETLKARRENFGNSLTAMTPARIAEAAEAYKILDEHGIGLLDATKGFLSAHQERKASIPFGQLFDLFMQAKEKRSKKYRTQLKWAKDRLEPLHTRVASDVTVRDLDAILKGEKATVKNAFMRYLRAVFNWGLKRDYLSNNPIAKMDFEEVVKGQTEIFEPKLVQALLNDCLANDLALLPYRVFGFFLGVRPDGELLRVEWEDFHWSDKVLKLRAEITKKKRLRFVDVSDNAFEWLQEYRKRGGKTEGLIMPFTAGELRDHHRENWARVVGVTKDGKPKRRWVQQVARHSFCSYWLAEHGDIDRLVILSGHESKEAMWNSYYRAATKDTAKKFWSINPPKSAKNVIVFRKTA